MRAVKEVVGTVATAEEEVTQKAALAEAVEKVELEEISMMIQIE
jgi:hypothetical protein